jgi:hypothetical protein
MGLGYPRPLCTFFLEADFLDTGTTALARSPAPVPAGSEESATAKPEMVEGQKGIFNVDIDIIASSPFGRTGDGKQIVALLRNWNATGKITYGVTHPIVDGDEPPRGEWEGNVMTINHEFSTNLGKTIVELVHEASHAIWRGGHSLKGKPESLEQAVENELFCVNKQLEIYKWLRDVRHFPTDLVLEMRLEQVAAKTLRSSIEEHEKKIREKP